MVRMLAGQIIEATTEEEPGTIVVNPTVTWNPSASPVEITLKEWNRDFELGNLDVWTTVNALISTEDPHLGDYCCDLTETGASIIQTLDEPVPVNAVYEFSAWVRKANAVFHYTLRMFHTDGTTNDVAGSITGDDWERVYFERSYMDTSKILEAIGVLSYTPGGGRGFVDAIFLGLAAEIISGIVESSQATPENLQGEMIARPKGGVLVTAYDDTTAGWALLGDGTDHVAEYTVPSADWKFELAKILVSCPNDVLYRLRWGAVVISAEVYVTGGIPFTDWFPWDYYTMRGDGTRTFNIQVMFPAGGAAAVCHAEIVGEYVPWDFN